MTPNHKRELELAEDAARRRYVLEQRLKKVSYRDIAEEIGVSPATVHTWVKQATSVFLPMDEAETLRAQELSNIDRDEKRASDMIDLISLQVHSYEEQGKDFTHLIAEVRHWQDMISRLRIERANLQGLRAAIKVQHNHTIRNVFDEEIESLVAELAGGGNVVSKPDDVLAVDE